jgi:hypothetical protein
MKRRSKAFAAAALPVAASAAMALGGPAKPAAASMQAYDQTVCDANQSAKYGCTHFYWVSESTATDKVFYQADVSACACTFNSGANWSANHYNIKNGSVTNSVGMGPFYANDHAVGDGLYPVSDTHYGAHLYSYDSYVRSESDIFQGCSSGCGGGFWVYNAKTLYTP